MKRGDNVYVALVGDDGDCIKEVILEEVGINRAILRIKKANSNPYWQQPDRFISYPLTHVFATKTEAKTFLCFSTPQVGDYVAVVNCENLIRGLVVKLTPKMVDIILSDEEDIKHNKGKMKARYFKRHVVSLLRNNT